ncbi:MOLPALP family lipoprotein [Mesoplasma lactucae]|uniref:Uncharacterized protein n=1 Tax=Mesoplasma lactucae ATCC 49193 TaxID=81460 RepID=A0A291IQX5_9MOLU|nr:MOLPALP family lipoprotein [Mesoplasma lactucae]ATG97345.1 hypothetical protein CP520_01055 [Mesoplasma lactucae ATCC 49193]ATZ20203.1 MOLPALP family lipoprotein [Mesoplasma lactucae ATCC 49193]MCL8216952.1 hypothetical protein [Mesoplasma lactucae ATCC 49193]
MKKLLMSLSAILITASSATSVISCSYHSDMKHASEEETKRYAEISAEALKSAVLYDQNFDIRGKSVAINNDFSSGYYKSALIKDVFPNLINENKNISISNDSEVAELYKMAFGTGRDGFNYTFESSVKYGDLKLDGVSAGSNIADFIEKQTNDKAPDVETAQPDNSISKTLNLISSTLKIVFGNDFTPQTAGLLTGIIKSGVVSNALGGMFHTDNNPVKNAINKAESIINDSNNAGAINEVLTAITQENIANDISMRDVLSNGMQSLFSSLLFLVKNQKINQDELKKKENEEWSASKLFFVSLLGGNIPDGLLTEANADTKISETILAVAGILNCTNAIYQYISMFDKYKSYTEEWGQPVSIDHLFNRKKTNGEIIRDILDSKYKSNEYAWYQENGNQTKYAIINFQNLVSTLQMFFSPDPEDREGYQTLKLFTILFGRPTIDGRKGNNPIADYGSSPITETIVENGISYAVGNKIASLIPNTVADSISGLLQPIPGLVSNFINVTIDCVLTNGSWTNKYGAIIDVATLLSGELNKLTSQIDKVVDALEQIIKKIDDLLPDGKKIPLDVDKIKNAIQKISDISGKINQVSRYLQGPGKGSLQKPWTGLYKGTFVYDIMKALQPVLNLDNNLLKKIKAIGNIKTILTTDIYTIFDMFGVNLSESLYDSLYELRNNSIADLINILAGEEFYNTSRYKTAKENNLYFLNSQDVKKIVNSLLPEATTADGKPYNAVKKMIKGEEVNVSPIELIIYSIIDGGKEIKTLPQEDLDIFNAYGAAGGSGVIYREGKAINIFTKDQAGKIYLDNNIIDRLVGLTPNEDFYKGTFFYSLSRMYGHHYENTNTTINPYFSRNKIVDGTVVAMTKAPIKMFDLFTEIGKMTAKSVSSFTNDVYGKYLDRKNFQIMDVKSENLDKRSSWDTKQKLTYKLKFLNPDNGEAVVYDVEWVRNSALAPNQGGTGGNYDGVGWQLVKLMK